MITASDAFLTAAGLFGFGAAGLVPARASDLRDQDLDDGGEAQPSPDLLSPGEPYFEAVAAALRRKGYLDA